MPNYQVISKLTHANKFWKRYSNYTFAAQDAVAPIVVQELPRALMHLPIGFIKQRDDFIPVVILGFQPGHNLFVTPEGRWIAGYTPAALRSYPFDLAESTDGKRVLVIDEDSGLVTGTEGQAFFDENGNPTKSIEDVLDFLIQVQANRTLTQRICAVLAECQLIQSWPISVEGNNSERTVEGLFRIDEAAMNALPADVFEVLRQAGALPLAYCQLLSMQHIQILGQLADAHNKIEQTAELNLGFLNDSGTIRFGP